VILVGDANDGNFKSRPEAERVLKEKGYEVIVHEHSNGHSMSRKEVEKVFEWIAEQVRASRKRRR
jgi:predicted esterase